MVRRVYQQQLAGPVPEFPSQIERRIDQYLARQAALKIEGLDAPVLGAKDAD